MKQVVLLRFLEYIRIAGLLAIACVMSLIFQWLDVPVSWMLGAMVVGIGFAIAQDRPQPLPTGLITVGKAIIGLATAARFSPETLSVAAGYALPLLLCIVITASFSMFNGYLLWRWANVDYATSFLGSVPGTASSIVAMSEEVGADAIAVTLLQYLRLLMVVVLFPAAVRTLLPAHAIPDMTDITDIQVNLSTSEDLVLPAIASLLLFLGCSVAGIWGGRALRLPASGFLGTFLVGFIAFWALPYEVHVPQWLFNIGLLMVGLSIGVKFNLQVARTLVKAVAIDACLVIGLMAICLGIGYGFHLVTDVDLTTAALSFTPGGVEAMIATAIQMGSDSGLVMASQMARMLFLLAIGPGIISVLASKKAKEEVL